MSIEDKFAYLRATKELIRLSIIDKGVDVPVETTFRGYTDKIGGLISMGDVDQINGEVVEDKIDYLDGTKEAIRTAIIGKGVAVPEEDTFRDYASRIAEIEGGGGGGISDYQMPLVLYAIRLRKPASDSATRLAIRYLDVDGPEGSLMELARGSATYNPFPTNTIDSQATSITSLGSSHSYGGNFDVENILSNDTSFWSAPGAQTTSASFVFVYFLSTIDAAPAKVTVQFSDTASNRAGPSEVTVYKFSKQANNYELIWMSDEDTAPWGSNEIREFVPGGE